MKEDYMGYGGDMTADEIIGTGKAKNSKGAAKKIIGGGKGNKIIGKGRAKKTRGAAKRIIGSGESDKLF